MHEAFALLKEGTARQAPLPPEGPAQLYPHGAVDDLEHGALPVYRLVVVRFDLKIIWKQKHPCVECFTHSVQGCSVRFRFSLYAAGLSEEASVLSAGVLSAASSTGAASSATALAATLAAAESPAVARMASLTSLSASGAGSAAEAALSQIRAWSRCRSGRSDTSCRSGG